MKNLILITALALAGMNNAQSIGITLNQVVFGTSLTTLDQVLAGTSGPNITLMMPPASFSEVTINDASPGMPLNYRDLDLHWNYSNSPETALFNGYWYLAGAVLNASATFQFTLTEPVNYTVTGSVRNHVDNFDMDFASISATIGYGTIPWLFNPQGFSASASVLGWENGPATLPAISGVFQPGEYFFRTSSFGSSSEANGGVTMRLTALSVPEGGATILLLGLALGVIGILRLPKALA